MLSFPNCKINLGLRITGKRTDGFHDLETIFYPLQLNDILEVIPSKTNTIEFSSTGLAIAGEQANNLAIKAYQLLKENFPELPVIKMHLHKIIPMGAGLGGGSADGAFALKLINSMFKLEIKDDELICYAAKLGSDCPFFIVNKPVLATGRGEIFESIDLNLDKYTIGLIHPKIHINTGLAFSKIKPVQPKEQLSDLIRQPMNEWKNVLHNDFEAVCFQEYKELAIIKKKLYDLGAIYSAMTGSGSTIYGIFENHNIDLSEIGYDYHIISPEKRSH